MSLEQKMDAVEDKKEMEEENEEEEIPEEVEENVVKEVKVLDAQEIFLLMHPDIRVSRTTRARWFFSHLDNEVAIDPLQTISDDSETQKEDHQELKVVGAVPINETANWKEDESKSYKYVLNPETTVRFLSHRYCFVFLLDLSPSSANVNVSLSSSSAIETALPSLRNALDGISRPMKVPGGNLVFAPNIFVTIIAWTSFLTLDAQMVLCQGWCLTNENIDDLLGVVSEKIRRLESKISGASQIVHTEVETIRAESERIMGGLFDMSPVPPLTTPSYPVASADAGFVNMLKTGMLALHLLPRYSSFGLIIIGDGITDMPDIDMCDNLLSQLRTKTISLSYLMSSKICSPHNALSRLSYRELLRFMTRSTFGTFMKEVPEPSGNEFEVNRYHEAFLIWSFLKALDETEPPFTPRQNQSYQFDLSGDSVFFNTYEEDDYGSLMKRNESDVVSSLSGLMSCRLREGFTVNQVSIDSKRETIEVSLTLPWNIIANIHYVIQSPWPLPATREAKCRVTIFLEADYNILHDITCQSDKKHLSKDRNLVIKRFFTSLQHITMVDKLLVHLEAFSSNDKSFYLIPTGLPLFVMEQNSPFPIAYQPEMIPAPFLTYWKPICSLDLNIWHRWMHTHRINFVLNHDSNFPRHFILPNASGRFTPVQSRKASGKLSAFFNAVTDFTLIENVSYIKYLYDGEDSEKPSNFVIFRLTSRPPCFVLWLAFPLGTSAALRHEQLSMVLEGIQKLTVEQRLPWSNDLNTITCRTNSVELPAAILVKKPVERMLVRYSSIPYDFDHLLDPVYLDLLPHYHGMVTMMYRGIMGRPSSGAFMTLARYLKHERWIWELHEGKHDLSLSFVSNLLLMLIKMRLKQGFHFAHSFNGVQTLVLEVPVKSRPLSNTGGSKNDQSMLIQFITFPPNREEQHFDDITEDGFDVESIIENESKTQIITEAWVEPQEGVISAENTIFSDFHGKTYNEVADIILNIDKDIIRTLTTVEYITCLCLDKISPSNNVTLIKKDPRRNFSNSVKVVPLTYDIVALADKSPQTEILLSSFIQELAFNQDGKSPSSRDLEALELNRINNKLMETLHQNLEEIFTKQLVLSAPECAELLAHLIRGESKRGHCSKIKFDPNRPPPNWKCYVKFFVGNYFLVTLVPSTFADSMCLILPTEKEIDNPNQVKLIRKPMPILQPKFFLETPASEMNSFAPSRSPGEIIQKRTQSVDNSDTPGNGRRRSVSGSDVIIQGLDKGRISRPRTNTFSHTNRGGGGGGERGTGGRTLGRGQVISRENQEIYAKEMAALARQIETKIKRIGSVAVPIFTYECHEHDLKESLLGRLKPPLSVTLNLQTNHEQKDQNDEDERERNFDLLLKTSSSRNFNSWKAKHLVTIQRMYMKSFVFVVFHALWNNIPVHSYDVKKAIDFCDTETVLNVDITSFLNTTCTFRIDSDEEEVDDLAQSTQQHQCNDGANGFIRKKFDDLLKYNFEHVPGHEDMLFFRPDQSHIVRSFMSRQRRDTRDTTTSSSQQEDDHIEFKPIEALKGVNEHASSTNSVETPFADHRRSISVMSNNGSEPSESNFSHADQDEDAIAPFFLKVSVTLKVDDEEIACCNIFQLPTCLWKLLRHFDDEGLLEDADLTSFSVCVDFLCKTLPLEDEEEESYCHTGSMGSNISTSRYQCRTMNSRLSTTSSNASSTEYKTPLELLPLIQRKALENLAEELEWMIRNEIISSKATGSEVGDEVLASVMEHISNSVEKPGCSLTKIPLSFVFGQTKSFDEFSKKLDTLHLDGFQLIKQKDLIYFIPSPVNEESEEIIVHDSVCWLILRIIANERLEIFFQYKEGHLASVLPWRKAQFQLISTLKSYIKWTNQYLLLEDLNLTRYCNRLLEPESDDEAWPLNDEDFDFNQETMLEANLKFKPGHFSCQVVWEAKIKLHPKLVQLQASEGTSIGLSALKRALGAFVITNRNNIYVIVDKKFDVFYFKIFEFVSLALQQREDQLLMLSRSSSCSSLSGGTKNTTQDSLDLSSSKSSGRSFKGDHIGIKFYGVSEPDEKMKTEFISFCQGKLDEHLVEIFSLMLQRNAQSKLSAPDVEFIQKHGSQSDAVELIDIENRIIPFLDMMLYFLKQNLEYNFLTVPKYHRCSRSKFKKSEFDNTSEAYLFNETGVHVGARRGLACVMKDLLVEGGESVKSTNLASRIIPHFEKFNIHDWESFLKVETTFQEPQQFALEFSIWALGKIDHGKLSERLHKSVWHSFWETKMEVIMLKQPIASPTSENSIGEMNPCFRQVIQDWMEQAVKENTPSLWRHEEQFSANIKSGDVIKEALRLISEQFPKTKPHVFHHENEQSVKLISSYPNLSRHDLAKFSIIVRPDCSQSTTLPLHQCLKFKPQGYMGESSSVPSTPTITSPVGSLHHSATVSAGLTAGESVVYIPRQCLVIISVTFDGIKIDSYNVATEINQELQKGTNRFVEWLCSRAHVGTSIVCQKMGIFNNQALSRKVKGVKCNNSMLVPKKLDLVVKNMKPTNEKSPVKEVVGKPDKALLFLFRHNQPDEALMSTPQDLLDPVLLYGNQMIQMSHSDQEKMSRFMSFWQKRSGDSLTPEGVQFLKSHGRLVYFCNTPILFLPKWRLKTIWTRQRVGNGQDEDDITNKCFRRSSLDEINNEALIKDFIKEFGKYVKAMGFLHIKTKPAENGADNTTSFLQKPIKHGILLLEFGIEEPFFFLKLYVLEETRLIARRKKSNTSISAKHKKTDEIEKLKSSFHLHSFAYDFHLRALQGFIDGSKTAHFRTGYNVVKFLSDFFKYYAKAPNFSRNLVYGGNLTEPCNEISPISLFNYLLSFEKNYNFKVMRLEPVLVDEDCRSFHNEFALTRSSQHKLSLSFPSDLKSTDEFDSTIVISLNREKSADKELSLDFYIILTNKELAAPTLNCDKNEGDFIPIQTNPEVLKRPENPNVWDIGFEDVVHVGYFSSQYVWLDNVMKWQLRVTEDSITKILSHAVIDCRRDALWYRVSNIEESATVSIQDFKELLSKVQTLEFPDISKYFDNHLKRKSVFFVRQLKKNFASSYRIFDEKSKLFFIIRQSNSFVMLVMNKKKLSRLRFYLVSKLHESAGKEKCNFVRNVSAAISQIMRNLQK